MLYDHDEEWRDVVGFEGLYSVSNKGEVYSHYNNQLLCPSKHRDGYLMVQLYKNGKQYLGMIHRLVAQAFIPNPNNLPFVNHLDEEPANNDVDNLAWCSVRDNNIYGYGHIQRIKSLSKPVTGYDPIHHKKVHFSSTREAQRQGYNAGAISSCCNGRHKTHRGMLWSYDDDVININ